MGASSYAERARVMQRVRAQKNKYLLCVLFLPLVFLIDACARHKVPAEKHPTISERKIEKKGAYHVVERHQTLYRICKTYGVDIREMEVAKDHVHLMVSFPPRRSIGEVVRILKSISARELFRTFPGLKARLWAGELWEDGYFARTVGDRMTSEIIQKYIQHHHVLEQGPAQLVLKLR